MISALRSAGKHDIANISGIKRESGTDLRPDAGVVHQTKVVPGEPDTPMYQAAAIRALSAISLTGIKLLVDKALF